MMLMMVALNTLQQQQQGQEQPRFSFVGRHMAMVVTKGITIIRTARIEMNVVITLRIAGRQ